VMTGYFVDGSMGAMLVVVRGPRNPPNGCILVIPPFAEEMNKTRPMVSAAATLLARNGYTAVVPDLYGTGDSAGSFSDASVTNWLDDISQVHRWCSHRGHPVTGLIAVRLGAALALAALDAGQIPQVDDSVLWQPVFDGSRFFTQFLRLRAAASMMAGGAVESVEDLRKKLMGGEPLEVAGYPVSGRLASEIDGLRSPKCLPEGFGRIHWMEVVRSADAEWPLQSVKLIEQTQAAGNAVNATRFVGEPFWATTEIVRVGAMVAATAASFQRVEA